MFEIDVTSVKARIGKIDRWGLTKIRNHQDEQEDDKLYGVNTLLEPYREYNKDCRILKDFMLAYPNLTTNGESHSVKLTSTLQRTHPIQQGIDFQLAEEVLFSKATKHNDGKSNYKLYREQS